MVGTFKALLCGVVPPELSVPQSLGGGGLGCAPSALLGLSFLPLNTSACDFSSVWATPVA